MSCGVGHRHGSDTALLWCRAAATAPIRPLAWEPPFAAGVALGKKKFTELNTRETGAISACCALMKGSKDKRKEALGRQDQCDLAISWVLGTERSGHQPSKRWAASALN